MAIVLTGLGLLALPGCAGPSWFTSGEGELSPHDPYAPYVFPKAKSQQRGNSPPNRPSPASGTSTASPASPPSVNTADVQRQQAIDEQLAKYKKYAQAKPTGEATNPQATPVAEQNTRPEPVALTPPTMQRLPSVDDAASEKSAEQPEETSTVSIAQDNTAAEQANSAKIDTSEKEPDSQAVATASEVKPVAANSSKAAKSAVAPASASDEDSGAVKPASLEQPTSDNDSASPSDRKAEESKGDAYQSGDWQKQRDQLLASLQEEILLAKKDPARVSEARQLETVLRMQYALAGEREEAAKPIEGLRDAEQEFWRNEAFGIVDLLGPDRVSSESRRYAVALKSLQEAESHLAAASSLALRNLALCRKVQDFGVIERFSKNDFTPNQEVLLYVEVQNLAAQKHGDQAYETELQGSFRVLDRTGAARAERTLPLDKQTCANLRRDYYIAYRLYIPSELAPGAYTLELTIEDKKGNKSNNALLDFNVTQ